MNCPTDAKGAVVWFYYHGAPLFLKAPTTTLSAKERSILKTIPAPKAGYFLATFFHFPYNEEKNFFISHVHIKAIFSIYIVEGTSL